MIISATFRGSEQIGVNAYRAKLRLVDDVVGTFDEWFTVTGSTVLELRDDASRQIAERNALLARKDLLAGIAVGTNIPITPPAPAGPTAFETWRTKANRLRYAKSLGLTDAEAVSDISALETDVNADYTPGFVGQL